MVPVPAGLAAGTALLAGLLAVFETTIGLGPGGWAVGLGCGLVTLGVVARFAVALGPADLVTGTRLVLACAVAALVADSFVTQPTVRALGAITAVALALDAVDGRVARRTGDRVRVRRPVRRRGRRVPPAGPQRPRRKSLRRLGAGDRCRPLRLRGGGRRAALVPAPLPRRLLAQGGGGRPGSRAPRRCGRRASRTTLARAALVVALLCSAESFGRDVVGWRHRHARLPPAKPARPVAAGATVMSHDERVPSTRALEQARQVGLPRRASSSARRASCGRRDPGPGAARRHRPGATRCWTCAAGWRARVGW